MRGHPPPPAHIPPPPQPEANLPPSTRLSQRLRSSGSADCRCRGCNSGGGSAMLRSCRVYASIRFAV
eukprot:725684-Prorocentrum_minimum.AAC.1